MEIERLVDNLCLRLAFLGSQEKKDWWENYMKGAIGFYGVPMSQIRGELKNWVEEHTMSDSDLLEMSFLLFEKDIAEEKLAGILTLQLFLLERFEFLYLLERFNDLFENQLIFDWNTCDWFCVRVLRRLIEIHGSSCAE